MIQFFILYFIAAVFVSYIGRNSRLGFWGVLVVSFFITPVLTLIILILFGRTRALRSE
jgi:hypothetical protein